MPISSSEATRVPLRPILSPKWPKRTEPTGRATKATPKMANDERIAFTLDAFGKNSVGKTSTDAVA